MNARVDLTFRHEYEVELVEELPGGSGDRRVYFPGAKESGGKDGLLLRIDPQAGEPWLGVFAIGDVAGLNAVSSCPNPREVCVVSGGIGCIVRADDPGRWARVPVVPVTDVRPVPEHALLLLADFTAIAAWGVGGQVWKARSLACDDLRIDGVGADVVSGRGWDPARSQYVGFKVDLTTGRHEGGSCSD
jgi:hypothetical protein